jgi:hypothetical protein
MEVEQSQHDADVSGNDKFMDKSMDKMMDNKGSDKINQAKDVMTSNQKPADTVPPVVQKKWWQAEGPSLRFHVDLVECSTFLFHFVMCDHLNLYVKTLFNWIVPYSLFI